MTRPDHVFCLFVAITSYAAFGGELLYAQGSSSQGAANDVRAACAQDVQKLCANYGVPVVNGSAPKKADALNSDLCGAGAYTKLDLKNVTAWLDLRNKAAHGKYADYTQQQVELLSNAVRDFRERKRQQRNDATRAVWDQRPRLVCSACD